MAEGDISNSSVKRKNGDEDDGNPTTKKIRSNECVFQGFKLTKILNESSQKKLIIVQGCYEDEVEAKNAVVILEKLPFSLASAGDILSAATRSDVILENDIYKSFELFPAAPLTGIKSTLIYPATEKHIAKYTQQDVFLLRETAEDYAKITLPYIQSSQFSTQWVTNILEKKSESERIVFENTDKETGFVMLPDLKWDGKQTQDLYLVAIAHVSDVKSLRDLTAKHLPLLKNILEEGTLAIKEKYDVDHSQLRIYLHYQPSYYHLHVHFTHLRYDAPGSGAERAHLLADVIQNIELLGDYYQRVALSFTARLNDALYKAFQAAGRV